MRRLSGNQREKIIKVPEHKKIEGSRWHTEPDTWSFLGKAINLQYFKTEPE